MSPILHSLRNVFNFRGRASSREFIPFLLLSLFLGALFYFVPEEKVWYDWPVLIANLVAFVVLISLTVRRLHDVNKSGWWVLLSIIPIGFIILLIVFLMRKSDEGSNKYGPVSTI